MNQVVRPPMTIDTPDTSLVLPFQRPLYRFTVDQYHRMVEAGILNDNDRVELLKGWVVEKMPQNPPHSSSITRVNRRLSRVLPDEWILQVQGPITLQHSEPEPDFAVVRGPEETYLKRHPTPKDVAVLLEVADSSLLDDRLLKATLYAEARIAEYWIVNLVDKVIEVHSAPRGGQYRKKKVYAVGESVPLVLDGEEIAVFAVKDFVGS